jgi:chorismate--pyruvate lyase
VLTSAELPYDVREWLLDEGSLTEQLLKTSDGNFEVLRLRQEWSRPHLSEARLLDIPTGQEALVREVVLKCFEQPWVFARSVIPSRSLTGKLRHLRGLENKSLGALLFQDPSLQRNPFQVAHIPGDSSYIPAELQQDQPAWARRSRFVVQGNPLMVSEVFLQAYRH